VKSLKFVVVVLVGLGLLAAFLGPLSWYATASNLPASVDSPLSLEMALRLSIESERQGVELQKEASRRVSLKWEKPDFTRIPKDMVSLYVNEQGCPKFFQSPRETGFAWKRRVVESLRKKYPSGDGACELLFIQNLALQLGAKTPMEIAVLSDQIHAQLQKDEMVAFDLHSIRFGEGFVGIETASRLALKKDLASLTLAEMAELQLAIPPYDSLQEVALCKNPPLLKLSRDSVLDNLEMSGLVPHDNVRVAKSQPLRCSTIRQ
jgi:hypothetical protein